MRGERLGEPILPLAALPVFPYPRQSILRTSVQVRANISTSSLRAGGAIGFNLEGWLSRADSSAAP